MDWIIGIASVFLGSGLISKLIMYLIKRHDEETNKYKKVYEILINNISEYGKLLYKAYYKWYDNVNNIATWIKEYINITRDFNDKFTFLEENYKDLIKTNCDKLCQYAEICSKRIEGEMPEDVQDCIEKFEFINKNFETKRSELEKNCIDLINEIEQIISDYQDILNHFPELYSIPKKSFNFIFKQFSEIQSLNSKLSITLHTIKSDPLYNIGSEEYSIGSSILKIIEKVEYTKIRIVNLMNEK